MSNKTAHGEVPMNVGDECPICTDIMCDNDSICLPGCNHRFHVRCVMNFCRYDTHCPICRRLPEGVDVIERHTPSSQVSVLMNLVDVDSVIDEQRRVWRLYRTRRRRALNRNPHLNTLFGRLQTLRGEISGMHTTTQRLYYRRCREIWNTDIELNNQLRLIRCMRRRERRITRSLSDHLNAIIGPEP